MRFVTPLEVATHFELVWHNEAELVKLIWGQGEDVSGGYASVSLAQQDVPL